MLRYREVDRGCERIWRPPHFYACYIRILITFNTLHILIIALLQCAKPSFKLIYNLFDIQPVQVQNPIRLFLTPSSKPSGHSMHHQV